MNSKPFAVISILHKYDYIFSFYCAFLPLVVISILHKYDYINRCTY